MKNRYYACGARARRVLLAATLPLVLLTNHLYAQPQSRGPHQQRPEEPPRAERRRAQENAARGPGMQWLRDLAQSDPETFKTAQALREQDPEAFAKWAREYMAQHRRQAILERHPALKTFLEELPEDERVALEEDLFHAARGHRARQDRPQEGPDRATRITRREKMDAETFDARTQHFENELERAEERIRLLRELLERRRAMREKVLENN